MNRFPAWVLSLADAQERREGIRQTLSRCACLAWQFHDAIDGRRGGLIQAPYAVGKTLRWQGYPLTPAEIACVEGHRGMWRAFLSGGEPIGIFLEDDIRVNDRFCELIAAAAGASEAWDLLRLECVFARRVIRRLGTVSPGVSLVVRRHDCRGSAAYMLTRDAAARLLAYTEPFWLPMDVILDRYWDHELRVRTLDPLPCAQGGITSDIGARNKPHCSFLIRCRREAVRAWDLARRYGFHLCGKRR